MHFGECVLLALSGRLIPEGNGMFPVLMTLYCTLGTHESLGEQLPPTRRIGDNGLIDLSLV
jgi:hypothetical protein